MRLWDRSNLRDRAMDNPAKLKQDIKRMMVENLMLQISADNIDDLQPLFGPGSLGLDSVDALQLVVALDKNYGFKIPNPDVARQVLQNVAAIAQAVAAHLAAQAPPATPGDTPLPGSPSAASGQ